MLNHNLKEDDRAGVIADLIGQNLSQSEIGRRLGISRARVGQIALAHRLAISTARAGRPISKRQARILDFIRDFTTHNPYPPTVREIAMGCNLSSPSVADYNLLCLEEKGYLTRVPAIARGIVLTGRGMSDTTA